MRWITVSALALLALLLGLLVSGVLTGNRDPGGDGTATVPEPGTVPVEPPIVSRLASPAEGDPRDGAPPTWIDGAEAFELRRFDEGTWLVVFADVHEVSVTQTVQAVWAIHRALRDSGVEVLLVLAREPFRADGELLELSAREEMLRRELGVPGDLHVWLDPTVGTQGRLRSRWKVRDAHAAYLIEDGQVRTHTSPSAGGFTRSRLEELAVRAIELAK